MLSVYIYMICMYMHINVYSHSNSPIPAQRAHMSICQNLRVGDYIRMGHEKLKRYKAMGHIEKRHPKLRAVQNPLSFVKEDPTGMNVIIIWPLVEGRAEEDYSSTTVYYQRRKIQPAAGDGRSSTKVVLPENAKPARRRRRPFQY